MKLSQKNEILTKYYLLTSELHYIQFDKKYWSRYGIDTYEQMCNRVNEINKELQFLRIDINSFIK